MANSFFKFKEFTIFQDQCGMKVTTDACLFGALIAEHHKGLEGGSRILDIGTGTGLLSLMLAQVAKTDSIDAIEIDQGAFQQAGVNFSASPWSDRLHIIHSSFQEFCKHGYPKFQPSNSSTFPHSYDLIICNPPFFRQHLIGQDTAKNKALHDGGDLLKVLPTGIGQLLSPKGQCFILLPDHEMSVFSAEMRQSGLFPQKEVIIYHKAGKPVFRKVTLFGKEEKGEIETEDLFIHQGSAPYSERFTALLKPYYLHL
ncbi:MAG: methyltransferase [Roseivirga sp.]|nr:methyltransferase [Roseivirga sp.]